MMIMKMMQQALLFVSFTTLFCPTAAFLAPRPVSYRLSLQVSSTTTSSTETLSLSLTKPLGLILEELEEGVTAGVFVKEIADSGSAAPYASQIVSSKLATVQGTDVTGLNFDAVMECIGNAPSTLEIQFMIPSTSNPDPKTYKIGTKVTIQLLQKNKPDLNIEAAVGDNLRKVLLDNGVEVYQGLKQTLGNCGGAGQCTFCAMDFVNSNSWEPRSEYEDQKLAKFPTARLACLNNIQGPATIRKTER